MVSCRLPMAIRLRVSTLALCAVVAIVGLPAAAVAQT